MSRRAGTSLIELLIALVVLAVFVSAMTGLILTNSRSDEDVDARREARGVARSAINIIESELRMAEPAGVIAPTNDSTLTFRQPFAFGIICATGGGNTTIGLLPSADLPSTLTVSGYAGWAYRDATSGSYVYDPTTSVTSGSATTCTSLSPSITPPTGGRVVQVPSAGGEAVGNVAMLYRQLTYSLRISTSMGLVAGRRGLFRTAGDNGTPEELAAPFTAGARFRWYILDDVEAEDALPADFADLRGIQFVLTAQSRNAPRNETSFATAPFTTSIFFQNRPN